MQKLAAATIHLCGVGALGSNLGVNLARTGVGSLTLIDCDRVDESNVGTQTYSIIDVGGRKAEILRNSLYRETGLEARAVVKEVTTKNVAKVLQGARLVVDTFDNSASRKVVFEYCRANSIACVHAGVNGGYGEVIWNEAYRVPSDFGLDTCGYPLARNLIMLVSTIASECLIRFVDTGTKENYSVTIGDLSINKTAKD